MNPMIINLCRALPIAALVLGTGACAHTARQEGSAIDGVTLDRAADRQQIAGILTRWEEAWNTHDMPAFARLFHENGIWILFTGEVWTGRQAIEDGHAAVHRTVFRNSIQRERLEELTFVGPDAAVVRFYSTLTGHATTPDKLIRSRKFLVVTRRDGGWKISWGQNTRLADSTPAEDMAGTPTLVELENFFDERREQMKK